MIRALALVALAAQLVHADPSKVGEAKAHFRQAKAYQEAGAFARAVDEYKAAYDLDPRPELLFNIAQAYRLAGDRAQALDHYRRYLVAQPDGKGAEEARVLVAELQRQLDEEAPAPPVEPLMPSPPPIEPAHIDAPPPARESRSTLKIAGIASAGVGLVAVGVGVKLGFDARAAADSITTHTGPWTMAEMTRFEDGQRASREMAIAYVAGGALVAAGGVMYWLGTRAQAVPVVTAQSAGVAVQGRF